MLLRNATLASFDPPSVELGDLRIVGSRIAERGHGLALHADEDLIDLDGALVFPGLVNAHTHLYSALARGMPGPVPPPRAFVDVLKGVWWRLDRALDEESVRWSALVGGIEAALSGTTLLVDHHSSPGWIRGSLDTIAGALEEVGLRCVLCYEVTDRNGPAGRDAGIAENEAFLAGAASESRRGLLGAHASFTLSEETLAGIAAALRRRASGLHIHVAEDWADVLDCQEKHGEDVPARLRRHGLLGPTTLFAHCVHLTPEQLTAAQADGVWVAHNPRSNMNNDVGYAATDALQHAALGTDGMDGDMLAEARAAFLQMREAGRVDAYRAALDLLAGGHRLAAALFGLPFGALTAGAPADLVLARYDPPTPLHSGNLAGHLLFGLDRSHVSSVIVAGRFVVRDRKLLTLDSRATFERSRPAAAALWQRMERLPA